MSEPLTSKDLVVGGFYNWKGQPERLSYIGAQRYNGDSRTWHQFALVDVPGVCWCEVLDWQLNLFEVTERAAVQAAQPEAVPADCDVRTIMLDVVPGWDGEGVEVYAKSAQDVIEVLTKLSQRLEEWELGIRKLASAPTPEPMSAPTAEPSDADWADFGAWAERDKGAMDLLEKLIDVWDDGQLPHEHRCYVDGAWAELIAEARAAIRATKGGKL